MSRLALGVAVATLGAPLAQAQPAAEAAVRFRYEAPSELCPAASTFTARVRERTTRGREAEPEELARTFAVDIAPDATGFLGKIEFLDDAGAPVNRRVHGEECDAVVSSLALITALALDASLRDEADTEAAPTSTPPLAPAAESSVGTHEPVRHSALAARATPARASAPLLLSARVGVAVAYDSLVPAPGLGLLGQLDFRGDWALRLMAHYDAATIAVDEGREISVRLLGLSTSVCPLRPHVGELSLYTCAAFDVGSLRAKGVASDALRDAGSGTIWWLALGPELRLAWEPGLPFWLELRGAAAFPLLEHTFELTNPERIALHVDHDLTIQGGVAAGVRFW